ncbi:MAG: carboxypeptidase-like regulatory domain-containing protein [Prolixibacteraceae bacterium]
MMKATGIFILFLFFVPILSSAGEIYGTIKGDDGKPLVNQVVQIMQTDKVVGSATTDANGYFTVSLKEVGKFKLEVIGYKDAGFEVFSSNKSTRYNLLMSKTGDKWILKSL